VASAEDAREARKLLSETLRLDWRQVKRDQYGDD
jgi:hypothetical protein